jgi:hypothetical protein
MVGESCSIMEDCYMSKHNDHNPRWWSNKKSEGMDDKKSKGFGRRVAKAQGRGTKDDAKAAKQNVFNRGWHW